VIELEKARVSIRPKFDHGFKPLIQMIGFVEKLPFYTWQKGIVKDYVTEEDNLKQLRGRPDLLRNLRVNLGFPNRIYCRYDDLVTNQPENQVIRLALEVAAKFRLAPATIRRLNRFRSEFEQLCEVYEERQWPVFRYHRLNRHYEPVHVLAKYIVDQLSVNDIYHTSGTSFFSMLIDMNKLFEDFVATLLQQYLPKTYRVEAQRRITDAIQIGGASYRHIIPDLLVHDTTTKQTLVLDVKYKNYGMKNVDTADVFQLAFYAQYFRDQAETPHRSVIVYPRYKENPNDGEVRVQLLDRTSARGTLATKCLNIEWALEQIGCRNAKELEEMALRLAGGLVD
jgi:5-methylcytosine-specific restriction enzyme subunit McrC